MVEIVKNPPQTSCQRWFLIYEEILGKLMVARYGEAVAVDVPKETTVKSFRCCVRKAMLLRMVEIRTERHGNKLLIWEKK